MKSLNIGETASFTTYARKRNNCTGIFLKANETYTIQVTPIGQTWRDGWILKPFDANGRYISYLGLSGTILRVKNALWFSLCGCIADSAMPAFQIGELLQDFKPAQDGELITFANDVIGFYWHNNRGHIEATITRMK